MRKKEKMKDLVQKSGQLMDLMHELCNEGLGNDFLKRNSFHFLGQFVSEALFKSLSREEAHELLKIFREGGE